MLLLGETGVGKEVVAEQIHRQSPRARGRSCGSTARSLPEIAPRERAVRARARRVHRAPTSARPGYLETADGGTLFLDEIGELAARRCRPGCCACWRTARSCASAAARRSPVDLRVVAATNRDLEREVRAGRFRQDLFFRLSAFIIRLPPLRRAPVGDRAVRGAVRAPVRAADEPAPLRLERRRDVERLRAHDGRETCASCATPSSTRSCWPRTGSLPRSTCPTPCAPSHAGSGPRPAADARGQVAETERRAIEEAMRGRGRQPDPGGPSPRHLAPRAHLQARQARSERLNSSRHARVELRARAAARQQHGLVAQTQRQVLGARGSERAFVHEVGEAGR